jgi:DNA primase catalytic core
LCWLARREGFAVEREHGPPPDGTVFWAARRIRIPPGLNGEQAIWALAHQLGHVLLHHDPGCPPGVTTSGCAGLRKAEADSVAWITCARHSITPAGILPHPASWAGTDPRSQPAAAILAAGHRITAAAALITRHTSRLLHGDPAPALLARPGPAARPDHPRTGQQDTPSRAPQTDGAIRRILADAHAFYTGQIAGTWAPGYLHARGITAAAIADWHIGYAPAGWTALTSHLRRLGHGDDAIQAAGLATRSSRGTLIDRFRDRIMLPVHDADGRLAGFTGRAHPDARPGTPKYLNSPQTVTYNKSHLLFGLHQARPALARGAIPVIAEGAFDAIAVSLADSGYHVGLAPCGTALTYEQAAQLSQAADLSRTGILVAFDSDAAGRKASIRAHGILRSLTSKLQSAALDGKDPAEILQRDGPAALRVILREHRQPLSALLIDASIEQWERCLDDTGGPLLAMRSTAALVASLLPDGTASQIRGITGGRELQATDDLLRPADNPEISQIARILPADTSYQIVRAARKLAFDCTDVLAEVANAATRSDCSAGHPHHGRDCSWAASQLSTAGLASTSFPRPPLTAQVSLEPPGRPATPTSPQRLARLVR